MIFSAKSTTKNNVGNGSNGVKKVKLNKADLVSQKKV